MSSEVAGICVEFPLVIHEWSDRFGAMERVVDAHEAPSSLTRESLADAESWARATADGAIAAAS